MAVIDQIVDPYRGEAVILPFTMSPVVNISGWTLVFSLAKKLNSATKLLTKAMTILSGAAGTFEVELTEEETDLAPGTYYWDVWRNDEGYEQLLATGPFTVLPAVRTPATP